MPDPEEIANEALLANRELAAENAVLRERLASVQRTLHTIDQMAGAEWLMLVRAARDEGRDA